MARRLMLAFLGLVLFLWILTAYLMRDPRPISSYDPATYTPPPAIVTRQAEERLAALERQRKEEAAFLKTRAGQIWKKHPNWSKGDCLSISKREVRIGFTAEQVRAAWGRPDRVNTTVTANRKHEQWVYGDNQYAYIDDGILTSIQQSR